MKGGDNMTFDMIPHSFWTIPTRLPSTWADDTDGSFVQALPNGLSLAEDEKSIYVEAAVPGVDPKDIEITFDKGIVWIKAEKTSKEENKTYLRKASSSFSYRVTVPGDIDQNKEPEAKYAHGVMQIIFAKSPKSQPKKITVKTMS